MTTETTKKFNHAFSICFAVAGSDYEDAVACWMNERDKVISSVLARVSEMFKDGNEDYYANACDPYDTYEESSLTTTVDGEII
jgi:hypothetical protein